MELSIVVPCYNEEDNVPLVVKRFKELNPKDTELVLVDNGSSDNTRKIIEENCSDSIKLVVVENNVGYGNGVFTGLNAASGKYICWIHADLQTDMKLALDAYELAKSKENVFVIGKRSNRTFVETFLTYGMSVYCSFFLNEKLRDIGSQPKLIHRSFLDKFTDPPNDFMIELYSYYLAKKNKLEVIRIPVKLEKRIHGESKWNLGLKSRIKYIQNTMKYTRRLANANNSS